MKNKIIFFCSGLPLLCALIFGLALHSDKQKVVLTEAAPEFNELRDEAPFIIMPGPVATDAEVRSMIFRLMQAKGGTLLTPKLVCVYNNKFPVIELPYEKMTLAGAPTEFNDGACNGIISSWSVPIYSEELKSKLTKAAPEFNN